MTEETVGDGAPVVNDQLAHLIRDTNQTMKLMAAILEQILGQLGETREIPEGRVWPVARLKQQAHVGNDTWMKWVAGGLPILGIEGDERVSTSQFIAWAEQKPARTKTRRPKKGK